MVTDVSFTINFIKWGWGATDVVVIKGNFKLILVRNQLEFFLEVLILSVI